MTLRLRCVCVLMLFSLLPNNAAFAADLKLRAFGAKGDGQTDDRAAIEKALRESNGAVVDGEGAVYAIHGNIEISSDIYLRNATLAQMMSPVDIAKFIPSAQGKGKISVQPAEALKATVKTLPLMQANGVASYSEDVQLSAEQLKSVLPSIALNTLAIMGSKAKPVSVRIENVKVDRGGYAESGEPESGAILIQDASPVTLTNVEVTGNGKGHGIFVKDSSNIHLQQINVHDMRWAPYLGDNVFETADLKSVKEDFGWNTFPIYHLDRNRNQFVRVRIQEQIAGIEIRDCKDVELLDSQISRLQVKIGDALLPVQADGVTIANVSNLHVRNCHIYEVWEGIDFTSTYGNNFVIENCTASDTFTFGFKLAHPKRDGKLISCTAYRAGNAGFVMEPEMENIAFIGCHAYETGASGYWTKDDGSRVMTVGGFRLFSRPGLPTPVRVKFENCSAINTKSPGAMDFGFACDGGFDPSSREIFAVKCSVKGAKVADIHEIAIQ